MSNGPAPATLAFGPGPWASPLTYRGRLPGVLIEPPAPPPADTVRLDVCGFVGLAQRGPVDTPVAVEDAAAYRAVFGDDLVLASGEHGPVRAHLPTAVKAFFDTGGRRCYVVRVVGDAARSAEFLLDGLEAYDPVQPAWLTARASSPGAWGERLAAEVVVRERPLRIEQTAAGPSGLGGPLGSGVLTVSGPDAGAVQAGDVLRLTFPDAHLVGAAVVAAAEAATTGRRLHLDRVFLLDAAGSPLSPAWFEPPAALLAALLAPTAVAIMRVDLTVREVDPDSGVALRAERWGDLRLCPVGGDPGVRVPEGAGDPQSAAGPPPAQPGAAAWWGAALADSGLVDPGSGMPRVGDIVLPRPDRVLALAGLPCGEVEPLPLGRVHGADGLYPFDPVSLFLDAEFRGPSMPVGADDIASRADRRAVADAGAAPLRGVHALWSVAEVAVVSIPDAVHRRWEPATEVVVGSPPEPQVTSPPEVSPHDGFADCQPPSVPGPHDAPAPAQPTLREPRPVVVPPGAFTAADRQGLAAVHRSLVAMCAARRDLLALLSLPEHFGAVDAAGWADELATSALAQGQTLSYAALQHPWAQHGDRESTTLLSAQPPDGAVSGAIAAVERSSGPWASIAGVGLGGVGLSPRLSPGTYVALFDHRVNVLRQQDGRTLLLSGHTLSLDRSLSTIGVRRLLILLRRVALLRGQRYVFEPNGPALWRRAQRTFERLLDGLVAEGALLAYVVSAQAPANGDLGELVVELRVSPTSTMEFLTVQLVRSNSDRLTVREVTA